jgi:hypothetical protein
MTTALFTFRGQTVTAAQQERASRTDSGDTTGRIVWECSLCLLKWLSSDDHLSFLTAQPLPAARVLELSAGAGLVALALSACGATVVAAETAEQMPLLSRNLAGAAAAHGGGAAIAVEHYWGSPLGALGDPPFFDFALCSDVLYIALRDGLSRELSATLRWLVAGGAARGGLLFAFEERLVDEEGAFMAALGEPLPPATGRCAPGGAPPLRVAELPPPAGACALTQEEAARGCGCADDEGAQLGALFWQPPPVRLFLLTAVI